MGFLKKIGKELKRGTKKVKKLAKKVVNLQVDLLDPFGVVHKVKNPLIKALKDPTGAVLERVNPKLAKLRLNLGTAGATAISANIVGGALGLTPGLNDGATKLTGGATAVPKGDAMSFFDTINETLGKVQGVIGQGQGLLDQFGGHRESSPQPIYAEPPAQGTSIPTPLILGGAAVLLVVVVLARR